MENSVLNYIIGVMGSLIGLMIFVIGFFLKGFHKDVKELKVDLDGHKDQTDSDKHY